MNIVGVITEYNPYHNGHLYHVERARETCNADYVISIMSGHFLQRGEPALFNKWARAKMAVRGGVDLVIELPTAFSVRSAKTFAHGSVSLLHATRVTTHLCFGSEIGSTDDLWPAAKLLFDEPPEFKAHLNTYLSQGLSYPAARDKAVSSYSAETDSEGCPADILSSPNNILGIEYMKSLLELQSDIQPVTIKRHAAGYHDTDISQGGSIAS
ncbi:MAG TPA: nucleotidyltransferase family protein, partial [Desulfobacteria bacterium]|nr:nucleotidyltransferase family protein [Desulfobacteria bacterium]